jgi:DNA polymerase III subunit delta
MKYSNIRAFEKHLNEAEPEHLSPVYFIVCKDDHERKEAESLLIHTLLRNVGSREGALRVFEAERAFLQEILTDLASRSLFAEKRIILIRNADHLNKDGTTKLEEYFDFPSSSIFLIVSACAINRATKFYKQGEKAGIILDIPEEKSWEKENSLITKVMDWAEQSGKKLDHETARYFIQHTGMDQGLLRNEMDKLLCFAGERGHLTMQDISSVCTVVNTKDAWELGSAIFRREGATALHIATWLLTEGAPFFSLIRQLRSQFQTKLQISTLLEEGGGAQEVQQKYPYMKGQILQQNMHLAKSYGKEALKAGLLAIDETEMQAKNGSLDLELLTQRLIFKLI